MDSGIFDYLLGELIEVAVKESKGQLIFTCYSFRTLENLCQEYAVFTTPNPKDKYIHIKKHGHYQGAGEGSTYEIFCEGYRE